MFQVINPAGAADGKPDVEIGFRVTRLVGDREEAVGTLPAQRHGAATLPVDFDVAKGHPLFAAVQASLARLKAAAGGTDNLMPHILAAVRAYATVGEMCDALREVWGEYEETPVI